MSTTPGETKFQCFKFQFVPARFQLVADNNFFKSRKIWKRVCEDTKFDHFSKRWEYCMQPFFFMCCVSCPFVCQHSLPPPQQTHSNHDVPLSQTRTLICQPSAAALSMQALADRTRHTPQDRQIVQREFLGYSTVVGGYTVATACSSCHAGSTRETHDTSMTLLLSTTRQTKAQTEPSVNTTNNRTLQ